jgi:hypothetical protein
MEGLEGVRHVFQSYDVDDSEKITWIEFAAWMRRHGRYYSNNGNTDDYPL